MYAKLINGKLSPAPNSIKKENTVYQNYNLASNEKMLLTDGYKLVEETQPSADLKLPQKYYIENEDKIISVYADAYIEPNYREKRMAEYPDPREYLDAMVKINSGNEEMAKNGEQQLQKYYELCLAIKQKYPKE